MLAARGSLVARSRPRASLVLKGAAVLTRPRAALEVKAAVALPRSPVMRHAFAAGKRIGRRVASGLLVAKARARRALQAVPFVRALPRRRSLFTFLVAAGLPSGAAAQESVGPWSLMVRGTLSGSSYESAPVGYKLYSGVAIEVGVRRELSEVFAVELALRTESREVNGPPDGTDRLGGVEAVVLVPTLQWRPRGASDAAFQPYLGVGGAFTGVWEKSGALDSADLSPQLDPLVQLGLDFDLTHRVAVNLDARWQTLGWAIDDYVTPAPRVSVDPLVLGLGARVAF